MSPDVKTRRRRKAAARILVVDDESVTRNRIVRWLNADGYCCIEANDLEAAWTQLRSGTVDLVTLDVSMPADSGIVALRNIKREYPDTAVLMITATKDAKAVVEALTQGASSYLVKPVEHDGLLLHIGRALERRQLIIANREYAQQLEERVREQTLAVRRAHEETIYRLVSAATCRDEETGEHIQRVGLFAEVLARAADWSATDTEHLRLAAPMHDIGKIGIPDAILQKPGRLTRAEFEIMKTHTLIGAKILAGSEARMLRLAHEVALGHHERWDGSGYPVGLAGLDIPESARIVAIADVYDALTHDRVYRPALPEAEALEIMRQGVGTHFDPMLATLFFAHLPEIDRIAEEHREKAEEIDALGQPVPSETAAVGWALSTTNV
jgi:putative two-component system response regulator